MQSLRFRLVAALLAALVYLPASGLRAEPLPQKTASEATTKATVAVFSLAGPISESPQAGDPLFAAVGTESLRELVARLNKARDDAAVKAVVLLLDGSGVGSAQLEEIRQAIVGIQAAGKPVYAHVDALSMGSYTLLSAASRLSIVPTGDVWITGLYGEALYLRGLLDKLGIQPDFFTCGDYKSAGEMFMRSSPSQAAQENIDWLLDSTFASMISMMAESRKVSPDQVRAWINTGVYSAERAKEAGIVDAVQHRQDFLAELQKQFGDKIVLDKKYGKKKAVEVDLSSPFGLLKFYADLLAGTKPKKSVKDSVAIVYVEGAILPGDGGGTDPMSLLAGGGAYSTPIRKALDEAAADETVKAVVLRVNSPGGSAVASEIILDATKRVKAKKPFVVSMGDVAGSGGYYVACGSDTIFADRTTITGSIGVVMGKLATNGLWEKIGIHWSPRQRGEMAGALEAGRLFTDEERTRLQGWMDEVYTVFKGHVVAIRGPRLKKDIELLAGGRVYTGQQALELGLIDRLGSLQDAIQFVAGEAKLTDYEVRVLPRPKSFMDVLLADLTGGDADESGPAIGLVRRARQISLVSAALPVLEGLEPQRTRHVLAALRQLELLQQERVMLTMPAFRIGF